MQRQENRCGLFSPSIVHEVVCCAVIDYDALRVEVKHVFVEKIDEVRFALSRLQKAQRAAEQTLDMCEELLQQCFNVCCSKWMSRYEKVCGD